MAGVGLDTNLKRSETGVATAASVKASVSPQKTTTEARSLPIDEVKLSAGAKAMLKQAKDGEEAVRLFSSILSKGKNGKSNWYDSLLWGKGVKNTEADPANKSGEGLSKAEDAAEEARKREEFLNPPYDLTTGARKDRVPGSPTTQQELDQFYEDNWDVLVWFADGFTEQEDKERYLSALHSHTLNIQHAEDVPGLNFRRNETRFWNEHGGSVRVAPTHTPIREHGTYMVGGTEAFGPAYVTWD